MEPSAPASFWDAIRSWADAAGLLAPQPLGPDGRPLAPHVPEAVCAACPVCQAAATLDQLNPQVLADLGVVLRSVLDGLGAALAAAAVQRTGARTADQPGSTQPTEPAQSEPSERAAPAEPAEPAQPGQPEPARPTEPA